MDHKEDVIRWIEATDKRIADIELRINALVAFVGIDEFDADNAPSNLHRRLDQLEDKVYDRGDY